MCYRGAKRLWVSIFEEVSLATRCNWISFLSKVFFFSCNASTSMATTVILFPNSKVFYRGAKHGSAFVRKWVLQQDATEYLFFPRFFFSFSAATISPSTSIPTTYWFNFQTQECVIGGQNIFWSEFLRKWVLQLDATEYLFFPRFSFSAATLPLLVLLPPHVTTLATCWKLSGPVSQ